jgi:orotate phosphoribosyltransferase
MSYSLYREFVNAGIIMFKEVKLKSGETSHFYCNFRSLLTNPELMNKTAYAIIDKIREKNIQYDAICGVLTGAVPIASIIANKLGVKQILVRDKKKDYGMMNRIDGDLPIRSRVLVIEDVVTTGASVKEVIDVLRDEGYEVEDAICIMNRQSENKISIDVKMYSLTNGTMINDDFKYRLFQIIKQKQTALCLSLDIFNSWENAMELLDNCGPFICMVKTHADIMDGFNSSELLHYANKHNFLIMEDRKLIDVPHISIKQLENIEKWANCVTVCIQNYEDLRNNYKNNYNIELIAVCEMNTQNHSIFTPIEDLDFSHIQTIVSQNKYKKQKNILKLTPGVREENIDNNPRYRSIEQAISSML